jgi:hypothetical protein
MWYYFGGIAFSSSSGADGNALLLYYRPGPTEDTKACSSSRREFDSGGSLIPVGRRPHDSDCTSMFSVVDLHAYRRPRELTWLV